MKIIKSLITIIFTLFISINASQTQLHIKVISGRIGLGDLMPVESKYKSVAEDLDQKLKTTPNDTTALFYRAVLYLTFNSLLARPDLTTSEPTDKLLKAKNMSDRADSLEMKNVYLKILRAQICKELTYRYAPAQTWRFDSAQLADRKKKYDHYKDLANRCYDELILLDKSNAYDYQRLKIK